jgi:hypothetical protein
VATDQKTGTIDIEKDQAGSAIENELPTYRAISTRAVLSLICGGLAVCSFAHPFFYVFSFLAIALGISAHRTIRTYADMLTGHRLANAGIALGLVFGLISGTVSSVQYIVRTTQAEKFSKQYVQILKSPSFGDVLRQNMHPDMRKERTAAEILQEYESPTSKQARMMDMKFAPLVALRKRLTTLKDQDVHFVRIEAVGEDESSGEVQIYALSLFEVNGPVSKDFPEERQFALAIIKMRQKGRHYEWWVDDVRFPYIPKTFVPAPKAIDDGHGHAH